MPREKNLLIPNLEEGAHWENWNSPSGHPSQRDEWKTTLVLCLSNLWSSGSYWALSRCPTLCRGDEHCKSLSLSYSNLVGRQAYKQLQTKSLNWSIFSRFRNRVVKRNSSLSLLGKASGSRWQRNWASQNEDKFARKRRKIIPSNKNMVCSASFLDKWKSCMLRI